MTTFYGKYFDFVELSSPISYEEKAKLNEIPPDLTQKDGYWGMVGTWYCGSMYVRREIHVVCDIVNGKKTGLEKMWKLRVDFDAKLVKTLEDRYWDNGLLLWEKHMCYSEDGTIDVIMICYRGGKYSHTMRFIHPTRRIEEVWVNGIIYQPDAFKERRPSPIPLFHIVIE